MFYYSINRRILRQTLFKRRHLSRMKRLILILVTFLVIYVVYYDLTNGTLPAISKKKTEAQEIVVGEKEKEKKIKQPFFTYEVKPGETVLSIVEKQLNTAIPVSIDRVVKDFQSLNQIKPEKIQIGKSYKFPDYREKAKSNR